MPELDFTLQTQLPDTYRSARVRSLFNVTPEQASSVHIAASLPIEGQDWQIGVVVGPSGSGKSSVGARLWGEEAVFHGHDWSPTLPIIEQIGPEGDFDAATGALAAVGLGDVPAWLRPYHVLSNGERFRADMARILVDPPERVVIDEFTSVVDRQIAQVGAGAFAKAWRRTSGRQVVLLTPHYDVLPWLAPDWVLDTSSWEWTDGYLQPRPRFDLDVHQTSGRAWPLFEPHHYLKLPLPTPATYYVGTINAEPVCFLAVSTLGGRVGKLGGMITSARFTRMVVMPEWQGAGVGIRFLNWIAEEWYRGRNRYGLRLTGLMHTSHPGLVHALRRNPLWVQTNARLLGEQSAQLTSRVPTKQGRLVTHGGHIRAVQAFRYIGDRT